MPQIIEVPNYGQVEFPDDMTDEQIVAAIKKNSMGYKQEPKRAESTAADYVKGLGAGALRGAADIGNTLINASTFIPRQISPEFNQWNADRQAGLKDWTTSNEDLPLFTAGRIGTNIAGTAGVGGALAKVASMAPTLAKYAQLLESGGLKLGGAATNSGLANAALKVGAGAAQGAASASMIDPESAALGAAFGGALPSAGIVAPAIGRGVANFVGGIGTHTGGDSLKEAAKAGYRGGDALKSLTRNMSGNSNIADVLDTVKSNLHTMGQAKTAEYRAGMAQVSNDKTVLSFSGIDNAVNDALNMATFKGQVKNAKAADVQQKIAQEIRAWKALKPDDFHTPEGMDALKQKVGGILESIPFEEKTARTLASKIYNSIKHEINNQAPTYAKVMRQYSDASEQITEIERALSSGQKSSVDSGIRKLQSLMRNNANTNYGNRLALAKTLEQQGGQEFMPALAGQSLNSWTPRGLGGAVAGGLGLGGYALGGAPVAIPALALQSPKLMGYTALGAGLLGRVAEEVANVAQPTAGALANYYRR